MKLTFAQTSGFASDWRALHLTDDDLRELEAQLMRAPTAGAVMAGTNGLRKVRFAPASRWRGKSGAMRVCYVHLPEHELIFLIRMFAKNEKTNLSAAERALIRKLILVIKLALKR